MNRNHILVLACVLFLLGPACTPEADPSVDNGADTGAGPGTDNGGDPTAGLPVATFTIKKSGLRGNFDASGVSSPSCAADQILVRWDYTNDGTFDTDWTDEKTAVFTYPGDGKYSVTLEIKDTAGQTDLATRSFTITKVNTSPTAAFNVSMVKGMTASLDASSCSDLEDPVEDLAVRWDFDGDGTYDTDWTTAKTAEHTYTTAGEYTVKLQVRDLNMATRNASETIVASPITIRNSFITYGSPYMIALHFRMINNLTGQVVTPDDVPALTREHFTISEGNVPIDLSETNQLLYNGKRPMYLALLLDFTGSMYDAGGVTPMLEAACAFIDSQGSTTHVSLWAFWERQGGAGQILDFTRCTDSGKTALKDSLDAFAATYHDRGATEVWDVIKQIVDTTEEFPEYDTGINRGIVFLSDGHDTTSKTSVSALINAARKKAIFIFSVGLALRPEEYPSDEYDLKRIAEDTGGLYFTVNQVDDLSTVFNQMSEDVNADWTLSYITLKDFGTHKARVLCTYLHGYTTMEGKFPVTNDVRGDIKKGLLLAYPALDSPAGTTEYTLYAGYIPRNIAAFKVRVTSADPATLTLYDTDTICSPSDGWTISPDVAAGEDPPADGWYTLSCISFLEYGAWGRIARCTVSATGAPQVTFELPDAQGQSDLYGDKTFVFVKDGSATLTVP